MEVRFLDLAQQYAGYRGRVLQAITEVCDKQTFALGPAVAAFEKRAAAYCGVRHAVGVSSGTDALLVSLMALGVGPGDEVITTPFTFFATAGAISRLGARPVFVDVRPDTYNIDPDLIEPAVTDRTKAIIPVHLYGQAAAMEAIVEVASRHELKVIEDAAQAIGAERNGRRCGGLGDLAAFSFYPTKNLGGFGDGGMVTTDNDELAARVRILRDHGQDPRYYYHVIGGNFRLDGIQGAVLDVKLDYVDGWNARRRALARLYDRLLADSPVQTPLIEAENISCYHQYTIVAPRRDALKDYLADKGIGSAIFYPKPLHLQTCFKDLGYSPGDLPVAERLAEEVLSLPIYPELTDQQIHYVAGAIRAFYWAE